MYFWRLTVQFLNLQICISTIVNKINQSWEYSITNASKTKKIY